MRDRSEIKEYMQKYRFCKILAQMKKQQVQCTYCNKILETLHHKDENHANNRLVNLLPVCQQHHLEIPHKSDISYENAPDLPILRHKMAVTYPEVVGRMLQNCNIHRFYDLTLRKSSGYDKTIHIIEGSRHLVEFLDSLGWTAIIPKLR